MANKKKPSRAAQVAAAASGEAAHTRFQTGRSRTIHRREIKNAPYNPREISDENKRTLRALLDVDKGGVGLIQTLTWNELSGNLVSGHQRLGVLDALERHDNYLIEVSVVRLEHADEVAANIGLNNQNAQGHYVEELLANALKTPGLKLENTAFTFTDVQLTFEDPQLSTLFAPKGATRDLLTELGKTQSDAKAQQHTERGGSGGESAGTGSSPGDEPAAGKDADRAKKFRKAGKERFEAEDDTEVFAVVVFKTREEREAFMVRLGEDPEERYVDASKVTPLLGDGFDNRERATRPDNPPVPPPAAPEAPAAKPKTSKPKKPPGRAQTEAK